jgi:hypothetical protein
MLEDTDEYLYWNFTVNDRRRTLLYALDARKRSGNGKTLQKRPQGSFLL